jgi:hypothetical protein
MKVLQRQLPATNGQAVISARRVCLAQPFDDKVCRYEATGVASGEVLG